MLNKMPARFFAFSFYKNPSFHTLSKGSRNEIASGEPGTDAAIWPCHPVAQPFWGSAEWPRGNFSIVMKSRARLSLGEKIFGAADGESCRRIRDTWKLQQSSDLTQPFMVSARGCPRSISANDA
jgi:hypothetical protein